MTACRHLATAARVIIPMCPKDTFPLGRFKFDAPLLAAGYLIFRHRTVSGSVIRDLPEMGRSF